MARAVGFQAKMSKCAKVVRGRDEAAEEQRRHDRAGKGVGRDVVEVGDLGGEPGIVGPPERQPPDRVVHLARRRLRGRAANSASSREVGRQLRPERHARGAGQRRHGDDELRRLLVGERQRVGEHQPPLGVGVADLDRQPLAALQHVAGAEGAAGDGVLRGRDQHAQPQLQAGVHDHRGKAEHVRRAAHVLLHQRHAGRRLDVEPAGVEDDALADQRHLRIALAIPSACRSGRAAGRCPRRRRGSSGSRARALRPR